MPHPLRSIEDLVDAPYNPRTISDHALQGLKESLASFGDISGIVFNVRTGTLVCGHQRLRALRHQYGDDLKLLTQESSRYGQACLLLEGDDNPTSTFPIRVVDWPVEKERAANLAANHPGLQGQFDDGLLEVIEASKVADPDLFERLHLAELYDFLPPAVPDEGATDPDDVPEVVDEPVVKSGDLWICGEHRVLCGDSTKRDEVSRVLGDERPGILFTDPPYGVSHGAGTTKAVRIRGDITQAAIPLSFAVAVEVLDADARVFICGGSENVSMYVGLFDHYLQQHPRIIVWVKDAFVLRHHGFHSQYEFIYHGWKGKGGAVWFGDRTVSDVWSVSRAKETEHSTEKPVELPERAMRTSAGPDDAVFDPFLGSGSTMIAAERLDRKCVGIEIEPRYVQVAIQRWADFTKGDPVRERDGKRFSELTKEREEAR